MTTNELKEALNKLNYKLSNSRKCFTNIVNSSGYKMATINNIETLSIDTTWEDFQLLKNEEKEELMKIIIKYASTPIEEREEREKYYWKIKFDNYLTLGKYLNVMFDEKWLVLDTREDYSLSTKFTEKEYKKMVEDNFIPDIFEKEEINRSLPNYQLR